MEFEDRYGADVLSGDWRSCGVPVLRRVGAERGLVVEDAASGYCGAVVRVENRLVHLEDRFGGVRVFPLGPGFLIDGAPVILERVQAGTPAPRQRTASGSFRAEDAPARTARASRIFVEGRHDAELVEKVWGDDLRVEGVVVEYLEGVDKLDAILKEFAPGPGRRVGVLVDHLVPGSKESRLAEAASRGPYGGDLLIVGHPYIDIWQAVRPQRVGLDKWPSIPRSVEWKHGICQALGLPHRDQADIARAWRKILSRVGSYADLEPALLGRVEELIDFVTAV